MDITASDQSQCRRLLDLRDGGMSFTSFVYRFRRRYILRAAILVAAAFFFISSDDGKVCGIFIAGMVFGMVIQDYSWCAGMQHTWPLTARLTNWTLVEEIANGAKSAEVE